MSMGYPHLVRTLTYAEQDNEDIAIFPEIRERSCLYLMGLNNETQLFVYDDLFVVNYI